MPMMAAGALTTVMDFSLDNSRKVFYVPFARQWHLRHVFVSLATTATAGNRLLEMLLLDPWGNLLAKYQAGAVQAANLTRHYVFAPGHPQETSFSSAGLMLRALGSDLWLPEGAVIQVQDSAAIAATADDLRVTLLVDEGVR